MSKVSFRFTEVYGSEIVVHMDGDDVVRIDCWGNQYTRSYLPGGKLIVSSIESPDRTIIHLSQEDMMKIYLNGGSFYAYVEDYAKFTVYPSWWSVEAAMAAEGDAPEWPLMEDDIGGDEGGGAFGLISLIAGIIGQVGDDEEEDEVGSPAPDWVLEAKLSDPSIEDIKAAEWEARFKELWGEDPIPNDDDDDPDIV